MNTISNLDLPKQTLLVDEMAKKYAHLQGVAARSYEDARPLLLIGLMHVSLCTGRRVKAGSMHDPVATKTALGWVVHGNTRSLSAPGEAPSHLCIRDRDEDATWSRAEQYFLVDGVGVSAGTSEVTSAEERRAKEIADRTFRFNGERYETGLLWRTDEAKLPDNYAAARRRLELLEKSLARRPGLTEWVDERIATMVANGHARILAPEELAEPRDRTWYLPMFVTFNPNKDPPKPRLVHDAAVECRGISLNSKLLKGPNLLTSLLGGIFRMRDVLPGSSH